MKFEIIRASAASMVAGAILRSLYVLDANDPTRAALKMIAQELQQGTTIIVRSHQDKKEVQPWK